MRYRNAILICSLILVVFLTAAAFYADLCSGAAPSASAKPAASSGCGSSCGAGGCGAPSAVQNPASQLKLTAVQQVKLAAIDKRSTAQTQQLRAKFMQKRDAVMKLIADPKSTNAAISKAMHELAGIQADLQLVSVFAQRDKDGIYTKGQKNQMVSARSSCGCGSSSGGCGAPAPSMQQKAK